MLEYCKKFLDVTDPTASLKHAAYAVVIVMSCIWLSYALFFKNGLDGMWLGVYTVLVGAVTTAKIVRGNEPAKESPEAKE